ncbi:nucleotidyltransferase domain-containing protein [Candidatus Woesearchaeota archaeon]|nr:nucleotidyltransferase domain-containing protein [Candidatus Woesearchaeota archaeon]
MNILQFFKTNQNVRKIFGIREIKIIEKQLLGINLTQSEKNRLSRDVRKKLECIKELARFSQEFELKKGVVIKERIRSTKEIILEDILFKKIKKIMLYGSTVENKRTYKSDIDIAIEFSNINIKEATLFRKRILGRSYSDIDIQVYNILPEKIKKEINATSKIIYQK